MRAFDEGTFGNYIRHCSVYLDFCELIGEKCFPLEPEKSALFVSYLDNGKRNADTIRNYHLSVRKVAQLLGVTVPKHEFPDVLLVLKGIKKTSVKAPRIAHPMMPEILLRIRNVLDLDDPVHAAMWSLFLTSFFLMLRKLNACYTPGTKNKFLLHKHVNFKKNSVLVHIFWTKMLQLGKIFLHMPLFSICTSDLCPVKAMRNIFHLVPLNSDDALFSYGNGKPVTYYHYQKFLKGCIASIGLNKNNFSTHSFRRGAVRWAIK